MAKNTRRPYSLRHEGQLLCLFKVGGKLYRRSLGTDVYSVAKLRLGDVIAEQRALCEEALATAAGKLTLVTRCGSIGAVSNPIRD